jgi:hypothetical protein
MITGTLKWRRPWQRLAATDHGETLVAWLEMVSPLKTGGPHRLPRCPGPEPVARRRGFRARHAVISRWSFASFGGLGLHRLFGTVRYPGAAHA